MRTANDEGREENRNILRNFDGVSETRAETQ
jgi:hypothetical protein